MDNTVERLNQFQKSVIIGTILGDGYIRIVPGRQNAFLEINHALSQREFVMWTYDKLKGIRAGVPKVRNGNGKRLAIRFYTRQSSELTKMHSLFYNNGVKVIPDDLPLDPVALAVWFMDDGSRCRESDVYLNTQQFDTKSQLILIQALKKLGLDATLNKDKEYQRIRFLKKSIPRLFELIKSHIIPSMYYKIGLESVETTRQSPTLITLDEDIVRSSK
ncbi:hypothetical protein A2392_00115 [Candidatus Kaiserbacteria bacterium RIFOXYB1_FULL_46_14]|uniref:Homing endonuclease LAGLIDADG domain-containing protein n=1 Tax=Candidatus Kaiserbacteria bacterium RIFOXYB1_FULL_46_14 TaxID=1798531 RepID=A0A1F6FK49_9BACT|nr:MAG: hypothetical protein A2392_00115 [Candidatus Kaiserbacteria bacterium RIFOXYB1_FULL_46_14]